MPIENAQEVSKNESINIKDNFYLDQDFYLKEIDGKKYQSNISEDIYFAEKIKHFGFKIMLDPLIRPGHIKTKTLRIE